MKNVEHEMRSIVAQLASMRAELAAIDNKAITHIDEADQAHAARVRLAGKLRALEARFASIEDRRPAAA